MSEVELPDYLPSKYQNWFELYLAVVKVLEDQGGINDETTVKLYDLGTKEEQQAFRENSEEVTYFYQHFPVTLIKSRALDYILGRMPNKEDLLKLYSAVVYNHYSSDSERSSMRAILYIFDKIP